MNKLDYEVIGKTLGKVSLKASPEQLAILSEFESELIEQLNLSGISLNRLEAITAHRVNYENHHCNSAQSPLAKAYQAHEQEALHASMSHK